MSNPTQSIMAKTCNSIIKIILLIIIISCTILYKVISFENYTHTHCGLFDHTIQHPYCGLFSHTIQHSFLTYKDHRNKRVQQRAHKNAKDWTYSELRDMLFFFFVKPLTYTYNNWCVKHICGTHIHQRLFHICISNMSCTHGHKQQIIKHHFQTQFWHTCATLKPWWSWYVPLLKVYLVGGRNGRTKKKGRKMKSR